ncbi:MAG: glycoside hydrolase family 95 protein [Clostridia bacterium]|nr:glycoside hydrolase family 95 protein [Clostridia bacterium]
MVRYTKPDDSLFLFDDRPAEAWTDAYPIGNGSLGAMVFGGTDRDRFSLNHDTLWSGYPRRDVWRNQGKAALDAVKEQVRAGNYLEADRLAAENFSEYASDMYCPMGELAVSFWGNETKRVSSFHRLLDLSRGIWASDYRLGGSIYRKLAFASFLDKALIYRVFCADDTFTCTIRFLSSLWSRSFVEDGCLYLEGECPVTSEQNLVRTDRTTLYSDKPEERGIRFLTGLGIRTDGSVRPVENSLRVENASYLEIYLTCETSFAGYDRHPFTEGRDYRRLCRESLSRVLKRADTDGFEDMLFSHIRDYQACFDRVSLSLGSDRLGRLPTRERVRRYGEGQEDAALPALLFNFGRYLTIAASRPGSQPMNLQGIWNEHFFAPWHSNYTVNINTEMNYFPTLACGLPEMCQPLNAMIADLAKTGQETAHRLYGAPGWVCHHNTDLWRHTQPVAGMAVWLFWNGAGGWMCHHLYEYYEYTMDKDFLRQTALPIMEGALTFYLSQLETAPDGSRILFPSTSPENQFFFEDGRSAVSETTEMTMSIVRELCANYLTACETLGVDNEVRRKAAEEYPKLRLPQIGSDGRILEWYREMPETEVCHRHLSHLYALHPGHEITPETTPELAEAARKSLIVRGDEGTGWSLAWKINMWARLQDGDHCAKLIRDQLRLVRGEETSAHGGGTYGNMFCAHPPFQIDGNFGAASGIAEMLLQSDMTTVHICPALPSAWKNVTVKGLCAKCGRVIDFTVRDGQLVHCTVNGHHPDRILFKGEDITSAFRHVARRKRVYGD